MRRCLVIHLGEQSENFTAELGDRRAEVLWRGCGRDLGRARALVRDHDGMVDAIGLDGIPMDLQLGDAHRRYRNGRELAAIATRTPVVDGGGVRPGLERWSVVLANRAEPGIFSQKRVLMVPGVNHVGLAHALGRLTPRVDYYDPEIFFGLPDVPGIGSPETSEARPSLPNGSRRSRPRPSTKSYHRRVRTHTETRRISAGPTSLPAMRA